jgi:hypothetical protein
MAKFLVVLGVLAVLGGIGYYVFFYNPSQPNVTLAIQVPDQVLVGEPFEATLSYANRSGDSLTDAKISLSLPQNVSILGQSENVKVDETPLGTLDPGKTGEKKVELIVLDDPQTVKRLNGKISYSLKNIQTSFETTAKADVVVGEAAATLQFNAPDTVVSGQTFEIVLHYKNNSGKDFQNAKIHIDYPPIYSMSQSTPQPSLGKNEWSLGTLAANAAGDIKIKGSAIGQDGTALNYTVHFLSNVGGQSYELQHQVAGVSISKSPLTLTVQVENSSTYVAKIGDTLHYVLKYQNNSQTALKDATIKAVLSGELYNFSTLRTDGVLNSVTNTLSWSGTNNADLKNIAPGASGQVAFEISLAGSFSIKRPNDKNYSLKVQAQMQSPTVPSGIQANETISAASLETKLQDQLDIFSTAYYYEPTTGIKNSGPYPPKANQPTTYTVHWKLVNYANDVSNVKISASLQSGGRFTGQVKSNMDTMPQYDSRTGQVTWTISFIPAGKGILTAAPEGVFQIEVTPALNQVGQNVTFLSASELVAVDNFTSVNLDVTAPAVDTSLPGDTRITVDDRRVK